MGKKKVVVPRPFHEVAFEILEGGRESEGYKKLDEWVSYGQYVTLVVAYLLTRCVVPEEAQPRIVLALIAASKKALLENAEVGTAVAFALTHFKPGKKGLKELEKLLLAEYLVTEEDSDEANGLEELFYALELEVPERPEK
ncbi:MAG: hypothetical protein AAB579_00485 [Patescibacteria group bacterium]